MLAINGQQQLFFVLKGFRVLFERTLVCYGVLLVSGFFPRAIGVYGCAFLAFLFPFLLRLVCP